MNSNRLVTLLVASTTSCFANIGPISLYTFAPSSKDFNSSNTISFSVACCVNVFRASMFACSSVFHRRIARDDAREKEKERVSFYRERTRWIKRTNLVATAESSRNPRGAFRVSSWCYCSSSSPFFLCRFDENSRVFFLKKFFLTTDFWHEISAKPTKRKELSLLLLLLYYVLLHRLTLPERRARERLGNDAFVSRCSFRSRREFNHAFYSRARMNSSSSSSSRI